jgi:hypothetical protein
LGVATESKILQNNAGDIHHLKAALPAEFESGIQPMTGRRRIRKIAREPECWQAVAQHSYEMPSPVSFSGLGHDRYDPPLRIATNGPGGGGIRLANQHRFGCAR